MWFLIIYGSMCLYAKAMDDLTIAGVYTVDRSLCRLWVDQMEINTALMKATVKYDISPSQAKEEAVRIASALRTQVIESGRVAEYCEARMVK